MKKEEKQKDQRGPETQRDQREDRKERKGDTTVYISANRSPVRRYHHRPDGPGGNYNGL